MISSLQIGHPNHTADNRVLYPVYFKTEFSLKAQQVYITESDRRALEREMEKLFAECKRKKQ